MHHQTDSANGPALSRVDIVRVDEQGTQVEPDLLAVEKPLEIRLGCDVLGRRTHHRIAITMRTPNDDADLALGFLFTEGIVQKPSDVAGVRCRDVDGLVHVDLRPGLAVDLPSLQRHFHTSSSCGVCGKASLEAIRTCRGVHLPEGRPVVAAATIQRLPEAIRASQSIFDSTGGLHAAALFDTEGNLLCLREDVGRHNALDKLIGAQFALGRVPLTDGVLLVSGRASFELVQKAIAAGIPILAAVGAPSSLAVETAREHGLTVAGFVRPDRFNIYAGAERIEEAAACNHPSLPLAIA